MCGALLCATPALAQELNCTVEVNSSQVSGTNKSVFETLQSAMNDYMNTTVFTNAQFSANEKIDCRLFFTIKEVDNDKLIGDLQVQSTRPVYNTNYTTPLINFKDSKIEFEYQEGEPLIFNLQNMESQLTAILNFYAYLILAVDFDSFSPKGGEPYFDRLKIIVQQAQSSGESGWKAFEDTKNRSAVLSSFTDAATSGIRDLMYEYHRKGLDEMSISPDKGRGVITQSLGNISKIYNVAPMSVALSMFKDAKLDELVNIYSKAPQDERQKVYDLLQPVYPTENSRLEKIRKGSEQ
ncbi:MAG: DUF4835 family protein [Muribaculaceae bacterium]|nr:DUF4835 family protein [Muribaculaceae bacterium]MDE6332675.1 DUF4835 family protein [Muribaculaceae bacterium]